MAYGPFGWIASLGGHRAVQIQRKLDEEVARNARIEAQGVSTGPEWNSVLEEIQLLQERLEVATLREKRRPMQ